MKAVRPVEGRSLEAGRRLIKAALTGRADGPRKAAVPPPDNPPDDAEVLRALPPISRGIPHFYEASRDNVQIVTERLVDRLDPPRFFPLVGRARLHHVQYKCTVYFTEVVVSGFPYPLKLAKPRVEVVYIDRDRLIRQE